MSYHNIPDYPATVTASNVLVRMIDGLGFRYYWATEGLTENEMQFRPHEISMSLIELLDHIHHLMNVSNRMLQGLENEKTPAIGLLQPVRSSTLKLIESISARVGNMSSEELAAAKFRRTDGTEFPFWHLLNGPVADALTHVGQINSWRRMAGNPAPKTDVFLGRAVS
jgi:hypothetical protein